MCSALLLLVWKDPYHMCSALGSRHERRSRTTYITDIKCIARLFRLMALRTTYITCVARLFRSWLKERRILQVQRACFASFLLQSRTNFPLSPIDSCQDELSPSDPIESTPLAPVNVLLPVLLTSVLRPFPVPVAIWLDPPAGEDNLTQVGVGCIGNVWGKVTIGPFFPRAGGSVIKISPQPAGVVGRLA